MDRTTIRVARNKIPVDRVSEGIEVNTVGIEVNRELVDLDGQAVEVNTVPVEVNNESVDRNKVPGGRNSLAFDLIDDLVGVNTIGIELITKNA